MSGAETVERIAARGDGVTTSGRHVPFGVPGDVVTADGALTPGPHHVAPPCRHFPQCGGCQLQHADEAALRDFVTARVAFAAEAQGIAVGTLLPTHLSPPRTRRRATLHAQRGGLIGFREEGSHRIVAMRECHVLAPELFALVAPLRALVDRHGGKRAVDIQLTLTDQGADCTLTGLEAEGLAADEALLGFAQGNALARLSLDTGYGPETRWEPAPVTVSLAGVPVPFPPGSFLQATRDGEDRLTGDAADWLAGAASVADLFAGLGTFAFTLAGPGTKVLAVEAAREAHLACKTAANARALPVHALHRDLFRNPLTPEEAGRFAALLLDPPRAGAREQVRAIAASDAARVVYVSCNPVSWARDAATLVAAGFRCEALRPVGQFRWSTHVELTSLFTR